MQTENKEWDTKRFELRLQIRKKQIDKLKKEKRQQQIALSQYWREGEVYEPVFRQPEKMYEQPYNYLQMLKEALCSPYTIHHKHTLPNILNHLLNFYTNIPTQCILLFWQCIAALFYETILPFPQLTTHALHLCQQQLNHTEDERIYERCVIVFENVTCHEDEQTTEWVWRCGILHDLLEKMNYFPCCDKLKLDILRLLGNVLERVVREEKSWNYSELLFGCLEENYEEEFLDKGTEICLALLGYDEVNKPLLIEEMENFLYQLLKCSIKINFLSELVYRILGIVLDLAKSNKLSFTISRITAFCMPRLLQTLNQTYLKDRELTFVIMSTELLIKLWERKYLEGYESILDIVGKVFDRWAECEDISAFSGEEELLSLILACVQHEEVFYYLVKEQEADNVLNAPLWELVVEFLKQVQLDRPESIYYFLEIMSIKDMPSLISYPHRSDIYEKVDGCLYSQEKSLSYLAQAAMDNFQSFIQQNQQS